MGTVPLKTGSCAQLVVRWYAVLLGVLCFGWPLLLGMREGPARWIWTVAACGLVMLSTAAAYRAAAHAGTVRVTPQRAPWALFILFAIVVAWAAVFPATSFSDEAAIALPALNVLSRIAQVLSWPGILVLTLFVAAFLAWFRAKLRDVHVWILLILLAGWSIALLLLHTHANTVFVRYPPAMQLMQLFSTAVGMGSASLMRLPNAFWTLLLCIAAWFLTPSFRPSARIATALAACLTPLGWTYHLLLYQACGEITLGLVAVFLLSQIVQREDGDTLGLYAGMLFGLWILYRPTIIAVVCATAIALWILRRRRAAWDTAAVALPVGLLWVAVYAFGAFQYAFLSGTSDRHFVLVTPILDTIAAIPDALHPVGLLILLAGSAVVFWRRAADRWPLAIAWLFAIANTVPQQLLTIDRWYGYGRFDVFLMLPLAVCAGSLTSWAADRKRLILIAFLFAVLVCTTPFSFLSFLQRYRSVSYLSRMERTVTGGVDVTPLPTVVHRLAAHAGTEVILAPDYSFLDLAIAHGDITVADRTTLLRRSASWTPSSTDRPVIIQAPRAGMTYRTNISGEQEDRLRSAAAWAEKQPGVERVVLGSEQTLIVP
ncbi:MAG TPA: hypothetical protein VHA78_01435 [Candidatus Peribacteraceae bacterium]|nr:hypothetical protein [Candidatus Peribacteraceae bacterium]